ncbi:hypothetical protein RRG08_031698 [Elysia crispata]|uniref:Uncharacterized protein n=1 Tax=Elysia crispata TaxID=231223 RepID=A0AAE1DV30_9GAST|nr:hypothetical protein RRG08_031698 [Elysia crispata]
MAPCDDGYISHLCSMLLHVLSLSSSHVFKNIPTAKHRTRSCKFQQPNAGQRAGREEKLNLYKKQEIQSYRITILRLSSTNCLYHLGILNCGFIDHRFQQLNTGQEATRKEQMALHKEQELQTKAKRKSGRCKKEIHESEQGQERNRWISTRTKRFEKAAELKL